MPKPRKPAPKRRDATAEALFELAELALDDFFAEDENEDAYDKWFRRTARSRNRATQSLPVLSTWDLDDDGMISLVPLPERHHFYIHVNHPEFRATIGGTYSIEDAELTSEVLETFDGSRRAARDVALAWIEAMDEAYASDPRVELLLEALQGHEAGIGSAPLLLSGTGADPTDPPPATEADAERIASLTRTLARSIGRGTPPELTPDDQAWMLGTPNALWPIVDGYIAACKTRRRDTDLLHAHSFLLTLQLETIRLRLERGWDWATHLVEAYQQRIIKLGQDQTIALEDWFELAAALGRAKVPVTAAFQQALADAGTPPEASEETHLASMRLLIGQMAEMVERPFEVIDAFSELTAVLPVAVRTFMAHELALSPHPVLRDAVPLMLLDGDAEVRRTAALALEQIADPETLSPDSLRRIIAVRNWVPETDRAAIDRVIRKARGKGVDCAQWPPAGDLTVLISAIDGSGNQTVIASAKTGRKALLAGILLRHGAGVDDAWCDRETPARDIAATLRSARQDTGAIEVDRRYLDMVVQNTIAAGLAAGHVPGPAVLDVAEALRGVDWQDRRLDIAAEAQRLFGELEVGQKSTRAIEASLLRSGAWDDDIAETWCEEGADVRAAIADGPDEDDAAAARQVLDVILPGVRMKWAEHFLLLALWARAAKAPAQRTRWADYAILAQALCGDRPLSEIPVMQAIAERSVEAAEAGPW